MKKCFCLFTVFLSLSLAATGQDKEEKEKKKESEEKLPIITESIAVTAKVPKDLPFATTAVVTSETIMPIAPRDITEILPYAAGTYVSTGNKNEWGIKIRGIDSSRITLLYDGVPVYEPYYNSFDLKSVSADMIDSISVVKGASSVLYGANAMGGIVDIRTQRPQKNALSLRTTYAAHNSYGVYGSGSLHLPRFILNAAASSEASDGFDFKNNGKRELRGNSDYRRGNFVGKFFYYPGSRIEILGEANYYDAEYGIPVATTFNKARFWRFKDWWRLMANLGASMPLAGDGYLKARAFYVKHYNVLDAYKSAAYDARQWESTYDNYTLGAFVLGMVPLGGRHEIHFSLNAKDDRVSQQADLGQPWEKFDHATYSAGVEEHFRIHGNVVLLTGASVDHLKKQTGEDKTTLNPILGVKYDPGEHVDLHLTFCQKSRFPSMKNLYSLPENGGNPDLRDERGENFEAGFTFDRGLILSGALFSNRIRDLIDRRILPDGSFLNINVARARIRGFEIEARRTFGRFALQAAYTYLVTENMETGRRLDGIPASQFSAQMHFSHPRLFSFTLWGLYASDATFLGAKEPFTVDSYIVANATLERQFGKFSLFFKVENLFDADYMTEPGFPMRARTLTGGMRFSLQEK